MRQQSMQYVNEINNKHDFKFIDLFAGIGGLRIPFESLGGKCVFTSEWDKRCQEVYFNNFGHKPEGDITKVPVGAIPKHDLLVAGFPCQPFSQAGLKKGFEDARGTLFFNIAKIIEHHHPKAVLLENVKRLRSHDNGNTFKVIEASLKSLGYSVYANVLNAKDFGVPQNRERIYIVALRGKAYFEFPEPCNRKTCVGQILDKKVDPKYTISDKLWNGHQRRKEEHIKKGNGFGYSLFDAKSKYTSTISARYYKDGSEILIAQDGKNPRKLTPREAARLQGFPEDYKICNSDSQAYKQFGNSVAIPVVFEVAKRMVALLPKIKNTTNKAVEPAKYIPPEIYSKLSA